MTEDFFNGYDFESNVKKSYENKNCTCKKCACCRWKQLLKYKNQQQKITNELVNRKNREIL